jgi:hypothetical protein
MRGQESAPIEVLIGVMILAATMTLALQIIKNVNESQCVAQVKSGVTDLRLALQDMALTSPPAKRKAVISFPACGSLVIDGIRFAHYSSPDLCAQCPGSYNGCWKIEPIGFDPREERYVQVQAATECVDMAAEVSLEQQISHNSECGEITNSPCSLDEDGNVVTDATEQCLDRTQFKEISGSGNNWKTVVLKEQKSIVIELTKDIRQSAGVQITGIQICAKNTTG